MTKARTIVLLHGYGSDPDDLVPLARNLEVACGIPVATPEGPLTAGAGRAWFPLDGITEENRSIRVAEAMPTVVERVQAALPDGTALKDAIIGGFSQGAIMALSVLAAGHDMAGVLAFSGRLAAPPPRPVARRPVLIAHGARDPVIPVDAARRSAAWLRATGAEVDLVIEPTLGHSIGPGGFEAALRLLAMPARVSS